MKLFAKVFGAEPWFAIRFPKKPWYFLAPEALEQSGKMFSASEQMAENKGMLLPVLIGNFSKSSI